MSKVGNPQVYVDGDQRNDKVTDHNIPPKYEEGQDNSHLDLDSKDERRIGNRLAAASKHDREVEREKAFSQTNPNVDPLGPARAHGNEPSRGAKVDAELKAEDEEMLRKKQK